MKIALVTPLYPPDVAEPAPFMKDLASRLSKDHSVTVLAYGSIPESLPKVTVRAISKHLPIPLRLLSCTYQILRLLKSCDVLFIESGPSVEVPAAIALAFSSKKVIFHLGDARTNARAANSRGLSYARRKLCALGVVLNTIPESRPEIFPLEAYPSDAMEKYELSWQDFLNEFHRLYAV